jgi:hypothetical protein
MARPVNEVEAELAKFSYEIRGKDLEQLCATLTNGERIVDGIAGYGDTGLLGRGSCGMFMTRARVFSLVQGSMAGRIPHLYFRDIAKVDVNAADFGVLVYGFGNSGYTAVRFSKGGLFSAPGVDRDAFTAFADRLQRRVAGEKSGGAGSASPSGTDLLSQLERLAALKDQGHLSATEFEAAKRKLLGT